MSKLNSSLIIIIFLATSACSPLLKNEISLEGEWYVKLDPNNEGISENGAGTRFKDFTIYLPGTLDDAGLGAKTLLEPELNNNVLSGLTRLHQFIGTVWYQKEIEIPKGWKDKGIELELERVIWESQLFIDGAMIGSRESLIAPHRYNLDNLLRPGKHTITIRIDNSNKYPLINVRGDKYPDPVNQDMAHAYTNHTQIKWNGIIGDIKLVASGKGGIDNLNIYSNVKEGLIKATFNNKSCNNGELKYQILSVDEEIIIEGIVEKGSEEIILQKPEGICFWDEFYPHLYDFKLITPDGPIVSRFGYRQVCNDNGVLKLNGKRIFLRGNLECAIFPLTGHPPMEKAEWALLIAKAKAYGLNHFRFHSYCPPDAAFEAADEAGFYFQVELPHWSLRFGEDKNTTDFLISEADRILDEYGSHPSFILMSLGNELQGNIELMNSFVANLKSKDSRHLYTTTTFSFQYPLGTLAQLEDDFFVTQKTDKGWIRGQGVFNSESPNFCKDYNHNSAHVPVPLISHEIGQYAVYPDLDEIDMYTGVLVPLNFIAIRKVLEQKGMIELADDFTFASGKLAAILYKEEIERALKTPAFDGFQLLQLQDFPGQGTALVGLLNAFWEPKGVVSAEEFRQFNSELVPLVRFEKAVYQNGETFNASLEVANFFKEFRGAKLDWFVNDESGASLLSGSCDNIDLVLGNNPDLGTISFDVKVDHAKKLLINVVLNGTDYKNSWPVWFYPDDVTVNSGNVLVTESLKDAQKALNSGKSVLLNPDYRKLKGVAGRFIPVFWSPVHFPNQPSTMGLLMDENHAAFNDFPTSSYTEWQWWDLCIQSKSLIVDSLDVTPIVRVIDNFVTNRNLSNVFETKVGKGKLIFSSIDLTSDLEKRPVARQLRSSLLQYMESQQFNPGGSVNIEDLNFFNKESEKEYNPSDIYEH